MAKKILIAGGGTGGHVFPGLCLAEEFRSRGYEVVWVGKKNGFEAKLVPPRGFRLIFIESGAVKNQSFLKKLTSIFKVAVSIFKSIAVLRKENPSAIIGVGGYVSVPVCIAGFLTRTPLFVQEQNVSVGIANRFIGLLAKKVFLGFEGGKKYFPRGNTLVTGNPIRSELLDAQRFSTLPSTPSILVFGGSQGAKVINETFTQLLPSLLAAYPHTSVVHQTGESQTEMIKKRYETMGVKATVVAFIDDMAQAYQNANLVICRSGALTITELLCVKRPAILVPFPRQGQNDQVDNAYHLEHLGVAKVVEQGEAFEMRLKTALEEGLRPPVLQERFEKFSQLRVSPASTTIFESVDRSLNV